MPGGYAETSTVAGPLSNCRILALVAASMSAPKAASAARTTRVPTRTYPAAPNSINANMGFVFMASLGIQSGTAGAAFGGGLGRTSGQEADRILQRHHNSTLADWPPLGAWQ